MWILFSVLACIVLIIFWKGPNAVWGGITLGLIVGIILAIISTFNGNGFDFIIIGKAIIVGVFAGFVFELVGKISGRK